MTFGKVYVVGTPEFTLGFRLAGVKDVIETPPGDTETFEKAIEEIINKGDAALIITTEEEFRKLPKKKKELLEKLTAPILIPISEETINTDALRKRIIEVVGVDLFG